MSTLSTVVTALSLVVVAGSVMLMVLTLRRERPLRRRELVVSVAVPVLVLAVFLRVLDAPMTGWSVLGLAAGGGLGVAVASVAELRPAGSTVLVRRSWWWLVAWAAAFGAAQLSVLGVGPAGAEGGLGALFLATGIAAGSSVTLAHRASEVCRPGSCPRCGGSPDDGPTCRGCGSVVLAHGRGVSP